MQIVRLASPGNANLLGGISGGAAGALSSSGTSLAHAAAIAASVIGSGGAGADHGGNRHGAVDCVRVTPDPSMVHDVLAVSYSDSVMPEDLLRANVAGFLVILEVIKL